MPKIKSNKGAVKRFGKTGTGKIKRRRAFHSHILTSKNQKRKRRLRSGSLISTVDAGHIRKLIPYV